MPERQGPPEVGERLGIREHLGRLLTGLPERPSRSSVAAGQLQVASHRCGRCAMQVGCPAVQQASTGQAGLVVDQCPEEVVAEVVVALPLPDQPATDELLERSEEETVAALEELVRGGSVGGGERGY